MASSRAPVVEIVSRSRAPTVLAAICAALVGSGTSFAEPRARSHRLSVGVGVGMRMTSFPGPYDYSSEAVLQRSPGFAGNAFLDLRVTPRVGFRTRVSFASTSTVIGECIDDCTYLPMPRELASFDITHTGVEVLVTVSPFSDFGGRLADVIVFAGPGFSHVELDAVERDIPSQYDEDLLMVVFGLALEQEIARGRLLLDASYAVSEFSFGLRPSERMRTTTLLVGYAIAL